MREIAIVSSNSSQEGIQQSLMSSGFRTTHYRTVEELTMSSTELEPDCILLFGIPIPAALKVLVERFQNAKLALIVNAGEARAAIASLPLSRVQAFSQPVDPDRFIASLRQSQGLGDVRRQGDEVYLGPISRFSSLSHREEEILDLVLKGLSSKQIAGMLSISIRTVDSHRANILRKVGARNSIELVRLYGSHKANLASRGATVGGITDGNHTEFESKCVNIPKE